MTAVDPDDGQSCLPQCAWDRAESSSGHGSSADRLAESLRSAGCSSLASLDAEVIAVMRLQGVEVLDGPSDWDSPLPPSPAVLQRERSSGLKASDRFTGGRGPSGLLSSLSLSVIALEDAKGLGDSMEGTLSAQDAFKGESFTWVRGETIGMGSMGSVFKGLDQKSGQLLAVKEVRIDKERSTEMKLLQALENEISILKELRHPRIVSFYGCDRMQDKLYVYLEYMAGGSLAQVIDHFGALDESLAASYTHDIVEGLAYLHSREPAVLHRDIKGANILVGLDCRVKLTDFGCSKRTEETAAVTLRGSIPWMAPEVVLQKGSGEPADVWSLGCVVVEMVSATQPWGGFDNQMTAMIRIGLSKDDLPIPECLSTLGQDFVRMCVNRDPELRATAEALLKHEFACALLETPID